MTRTCEVTSYVPSIRNGLIVETPPGANRSAVGPDGPMFDLADSGKPATGRLSAAAILALGTFPDDAYVTDQYIARASAEASTYLAKRLRSAVGRQMGTDLGLEYQAWSVLRGWGMRPGLCEELTGVKWPDGALLLDAPGTWAKAQQEAESQARKAKTAKKTTVKPPDPIVKSKCPADRAYVIYTKGRGPAELAQGSVLSRSELWQDPRTNEIVASLPVFPGKPWPKEWLPLARDVRMVQPGDELDLPESLHTLPARACTAHEWQLLQDLRARFASLHPIPADGPHNRSARHLKHWLALLERLGHASLLLPAGFDESWKQVFAIEAGVWGFGLDFGTVVDVLISLMQGAHNARVDREQTDPRTGIKRQWRWGATAAGEPAPPPNTEYRGWAPVDIQEMAAMSIEAVDSPMRMRWLALVPPGALSVAVDRTGEMASKFGPWIRKWVFTEKPEALTSAELVKALHEKGFEFNDEDPRVHSAVSAVLGGAGYTKQRLNHGGEREMAFVPTVKPGMSERERQIANAEWLIDHAGQAPTGGFTL